MLVIDDGVNVTPHALLNTKFINVFAADIFVDALVTFELNLFEYLFTIVKVVLSVYVYVIYGLYMTVEFSVDTNSTSYDISVSFPFFNIIPCFALFGDKWFHIYFDYRRPYEGWGLFAIEQLA